MPPLPPGHRILHVPEISSTNAEAMRLAQTGEATGLWVIADRQTAGRGRAGRTWETVPGNLMASVVVQLHEPPHRAPQLALVAGLALHEAVINSGALGETSALKLKWPNDVLLAGQKLGGILLESAGSSNAAGIIAVIGFGLNLAGHPDLPERPATHLAAHGAAMAPAEMLAMNGWRVGMRAGISRWFAQRGCSGPSGREQRSPSTRGQDLLRDGLRDWMTLAPCCWKRPMAGSRLTHSEMFRSPVDELNGTLKV
jgi:biotin-(acetyl-CoA carboxylase) ligase